MEWSTESIDTETIWILSIVSLLLLTLLVFGILQLYQRYFLKTKAVTVQKVNRVPDDFLLFVKTSKLVRFFSSEFVKFVCPREMRVGRKSVGQLYITTSDDLRKEFGHDASLKLSIQPWIKTDLTGSHFQISLDSEEYQPIANNYLEWRWKIVPLNSGLHNICLNLVVCIESSFGDTIHRMWLEERTIVVSSSIVNSIFFWIKSNWKWLAITAGGSLLLYPLLKNVIGLGN